MATRPIPPGDLDLEEMTVQTLRGEVAALTVYLSRVDAWRIRRARCFRLLRERDVPRNEVAGLAGVTPGAIKNLIDDLSRGEEAHAEGRACGRCEHPASWHHDRREHPKQAGAGCVPPDGAGLAGCFCTELVEEEA